MDGPIRRAATFALVTFVALITSARAEQVTVRHTEGLVHGFLVLRTLQGKMLAAGELTQAAHGDRVTTRLVFRFKDGSIHDETAVYTQRGSFRLLTDHLVQKGPTFPRTLDFSIDTAANEATVKYTDEDGKEKTATEKSDLPPDLANGMTMTLMKNIDPNTAGVTLSMVAATPKPRLVKLEITTAGKDAFTVGGVKRQATHYVVKVDIGGIAGVVAPIVGKEPPPHHVWILGGETPAFVKAEGPLYVGGPVWRIELTSPVWPKAL